MHPYLKDWTYPESKILEGRFDSEDSGKNCWRVVLILKIQGRFSQVTPARPPRNFGICMAKPLLRNTERSKTPTSDLAWYHARILEEIANTLKAVKRQPLTFEGFQTSTFDHTNTVCKANNFLDCDVTPEQVEISREHSGINLVQTFCRVLLWEVHYGATQRRNQD